MNMPRFLQKEECMKTVSDRNFWSARRCYPDLYTAHRSGSECFALAHFYYNKALFPPCDKKENKL